MRFLETENGNFGVKAAKELGPDLVIPDVMMPEMDGLDACRLIRVEPACAAIYVFMLSAKNETIDKVFGLDIGADSYMAKPIEADELKAQIRAGLCTVENRRQAIYDALTGLFNRRSFDDLMAREMASKERYEHALSLVMIELDHFKAVNDTHGHDSGDALLRDLADILRNVCRPSDLPCRWGGKEFVWLMPETDLEGASQAAERLRADIESHRFEKVGTLTASLGIAQAGQSDSAEQVHKRADEALCRAKDGGRNRVEVASA
jgi:two-component system cell cycle response regulator